MSFFVSGMHIQAAQIHNLRDRAQGCREGDGARGALGVGDAGKPIRTMTICISASWVMQRTGCSPTSMQPSHRRLGRSSLQRRSVCPLADFPLPAYDQN